MKTQHNKYVSNFVRKGIILYFIDYFTQCNVNSADENTENARIFQRYKNVYTFQSTQTLVIGSTKLSLHAIVMQKTDGRTRI